MLWQQDKQDVSFLASGSVQEVADLAPVAHLAAIKEDYHLYISLMDLEHPMKFKR